MVKIQKTIWWACLLGVPLYAQSSDPIVQFQTELDRTAVWLGDRLEYRITVLHNDGVEIIRDNLQEDDLNLEPFTLVDLQLGEREANPGKAFEIRLRLALLEKSGDEAVIPPLQIYYATRQAGPLGKGTDIETHTLLIPEQRVGLRSTLTSGSRDIRDSRTVAAPGWWSRIMWAPGWLVLGVFLVQGARWSWAQYREHTGRHHKIDQRMVQEDALRALDELSREVDEVDPVESCRQITEVVQNVLRHRFELEASALTPVELQQELARRDLAESTSEQLVRVLQTCETIRYAPPASANGERDIRELIGSCRSAIVELMHS